MEYYFHGTDQLYSGGLDIMIEIIESGGIKSKNQRGDTIPGKYNGGDYISLGKWDDENSSANSYESCFCGWIFGCPTFIIGSDIDAIHAERIRGEFDSNKERVSCFIDEYHVKDIIELDKIRGVALPFFLMKNDKDYLLKTLKILQYAKLYKWDVYESDIYLIDRIKKEDVFDDMKFNKKDI